MSAMRQTADQHQARSGGGHRPGAVARLLADSGPPEGWLVITGLPVGVNEVLRPRDAAG